MEDSNYFPKQGEGSLNEGFTIPLPIPSQNNDLNKGLNIPLPTPRQDDAPPPPPPSTTEE